MPARELVRAAALLEDAMGLGELRGRGLEPRVVVDVGPRVGHLLFVWRVFVEGGCFVSGAGLREYRV